MEVGTPVDLQAPTPLGLWLAKLLLSLRIEATTNVPLTNELLQVLPRADEPGQDGPMVAPSVVILRTDARE